MAEQMELELEVSRRVQAKLLAADETDEINSLGRTWQRVARSLRQTVALKAKLTRDRESAAREGAAAARSPAEPGRAALDTPELTAAERAHLDRAAARVRLRMELERRDWDAFDDATVHEVLLDLADEANVLETPLEILVEKVLAALGVGPGPARAGDAAGDGRGEAAPHAPGFDDSA